MEVFIPPWLRCNTPVERQRIDDMTTVFPPRYARGRQQRQLWADPRWGYRIKFSDLRLYEAAHMYRALSEARGRGITLRWSPPRTRRGSFVSTELLTVGTFENGTTGWTSSSASLGITSRDRMIRLHRTGTGDYYVYAAALTVTSGVAYVARAMAYTGRGSARAMAVPRLGNSGNGSANYGEAAVPIGSAKLSTFAATTASTTLNFSLADYATGYSKVSGDNQDVTFASVSRCALVNGGGQTGSGLNTDGWDANTVGLLLPGDLVEVNGELKEITAPVSSDSGGAAYMQFRPSLAYSPADNDPVIVTNPMGRFTVSDVSETEKLGVYLDVELSLEECYEE